MVLRKMANAVMRSITEESPDCIEHGVGAQAPASDSRCFEPERARKQVVN